MGKQFGAIYLILGTCVAAGMLGLPVVAAQNHLSLTVMMLLSAWILMSVGAWCLLKVTMTMPPRANLVSMSQKTLGNKVKIITWFVYLLLLYSLICAYLSATGDLLQHLSTKIHMAIPRWSATVLATLILGGVVSYGIRSVDMLNRLLMSTKLIICLLVIVTAAPFVHAKNLLPGDMTWHGNVWLVMICAFGYAIILPSIRDYLGGNKKQLMRVVLIGSVLPIILYLVWIVVVQGAVSRDALLSMNHSANTNSLLMGHLASLTHQAIIQSLSVVFISICSITGFLGVSLCLMDFLADGMTLEKEGKNTLILAAIAFIPPMSIVIIDPAIFIRALSYAGMCCLYILIGLPVAMAIALKRK